MKWLDRTHGTMFELTRHFLARMFDSEMFSTRGQWSGVAIGAFALALPAGMLLIDPPYFHKPVQQTLENLRAIAVADELAVLTFVFSITGFLALLAWQSLFPSRRDYLALASLPVRSWQIFTARFFSVSMLAVAVTVAMSLLPMAISPHQFTARGLAVTSVTARTVSSWMGCLFIFFAIVAIQGVLVNTLPPRWLTRVSTYIQGLLVAFFFLAGLYSWFLVDWREPELALLPRIGQWAPPVWFAGLHQKIAGDGNPFFTRMANRGLLATAAAVGLAALSYLFAYTRYRELLLESPDGAVRRNERKWSLFRLLSRDPRQQAIFQFLSKAISRSRLHRMVLTSYAGAAIAVMFNSVLLAGAAKRWPEWPSVLQFIVLYWPIGVSFIMLAGIRHAFLMPVERPSNWMFQITESQGRRAWMKAVERFVIVCVIAPIHLLTLPIAVTVLGLGIGSRMVALQWLVSLTAFEVLFSSWQQLPFTCSYAPGKRPLVALLTSWIAVLCILVPLLSRIVAAGSQMIEVFLFVGTILGAVWLWARRQRCEGWGESKLLYEDREGTVADLGIRNMVYGRSEPQPVAVTLRAYQTLASALPHEFKNVYQEDLAEMTEDSIKPIWRRYGLRGLAGLLSDLAIRIPSEYLAEIRQDLRYGWRMLAASPGFTLVAVVSLGLGIGMGTAPFSFIDATLLRDVPGLAAPDELVTLRSAVAYPNYEHYAEQHELFFSTLAYAPAPFKVFFEGRNERIWGHLVTPSYFSTLGVPLIAGHGFEFSSGRGVVVSHRFARERFGSEWSGIGKTLRINGSLFTVFGVTPPDFLGASPMLYEADLWIPLEAAVGVAPELAGDALHRRDVAIFRMVARLNRGVKASRAEVALEAIARRMEKAYGDPDADRKGRRVEVITGGRMVPFRRENLAMLVTAPVVLVALLLLVACANVANMMLARATARRREISVRLAIGASRARLIRQLLTESMLVAAGASIVGYSFALWLMRLLSQADVMRIAFRSPYPIPVSANLAPDGRALLATLALTIFTGLAFGLAPALRSTRSDLTLSLKDGGSVRLRPRGLFSLRNVLMISQTAAALTLLLITGILARGYQKAFAIDVGFNPSDLYTISLDPVRDGYSGEKTAALFEKLQERLRGVSAITSASLSGTSPMWSPPAVTTFLAFNSDRQVIGTAERYLVGVGYFETLGVPVIFGRGFHKDDESAVIVNERLARDYFKDQNPVGRGIEIDRKSHQIIGVIRNTKMTFALGQTSSALYLPLRAQDFARPSYAGVTLLARTLPGADGLELLRREIAVIDPNLTPFYGFRMPEQLDRLKYFSRIGISIQTFDGMFGLILSMIGLAGMTAYSVAQRAREIGIRIALGARNVDVLGMVMKEGATLVLIGVTIGVAAAWAGIRLLAGITFAIATTTGGYVAEPAMWIGTTLLLASLALIACYIPARKSLRIDPVISLRME